MAHGPVLQLSWLFLQHDAQGHLQALILKIAIDFRQCGGYALSSQRDDM